MKTTYERAILNLIKDISLVHFLIDILYQAEEEDYTFKEGDCIETTKFGITFSFTWDYITVTNNKTNEVVHSTSNKEEVKEFIYNYYKEN